MYDLTFSKVFALSLERVQLYKSQSCGCYLAAASSSFDLLGAADCSNNSAYSTVLNSHIAYNLNLTKGY